MSITYVTSMVGVADALERFKAFGAAHSKSVLVESAKVGAKLAVQKALEEMQHTPAGIHWPRQPNPSSRPYNYPAIQEGKLIDSFEIKEESSPQDVGRVSWNAGNAEVPYARAIEFGYGEHLLPRSYMRTTVDKYNDEINLAMADVVRREKERRS